MKRREFITQSSLGLLTVYGAPSLLRSAVQSVGKDAPAPIRYIRPHIPEFAIPGPRGRFYDATIPATLDLADMARISVEGVLTRQTDPEHDYEVYCQANFNKPALMYHSFHDFNGCQPKFTEALPLLRSICGSTVNFEADEGLFRALMRMVGEDGLTNVPVKGRPWALFDDWGSVLRPPNLPPADVQHISNLYPGGRALLAMAAWRLHDPDNPFVADLVRKMVGVYTKIGAEKDGLVWFPYELLYTTPGGVLAAGGAYGGEASAPEPFDTAMAKGRSAPLKIIPGACTDAGATLQGLARVMRTTGEEQAGVLAGKLAKYVKQAFNDDGSFKWGHIHLNCFALISLLDYSDAVGDQDLKGLVKRGYEFARSTGLPLVGFFPEYINMEMVGLTPVASGNPNEKKHLKVTSAHATSESCATADMTVLAIKLTEYGVADYWEDIDRYVRNHLAEAQLRNIEWIERAQQPPEQARQPPIGNCFMDDPKLKGLLDVPGFLVRKNVPERIRGAFATTCAINDWDPPQVRPGGMGVSGCCTGNGTRALYFAWRAILTQKGDGLWINLLLNRASIWADVDSRIPYEGRVDIHMKMAQHLRVRMPEWVSREAVRLQVGNEKHAFAWSGRYLDAGMVEGGRTVTIEFPLEERTLTVDVPFGKVQKATMILRGNDVVAIDPPGLNCPFYQRDHYRQGQTLWKKIKRWEPAEIFRV